MIRGFTINRVGRCPAKKMPGHTAMRTRQKDFRRDGYNPGATGAQ